mmetsp:Transcript_45762/g.85769  ORF Transcript_45762/g.85769 Transcript_45762/m.85769 type:complete len:120 (+) Transcript_45762:36-395(+)
MIQMCAVILSCFEQRHLQQQFLPRFFMPTFDLARVAARSQYMPPFSSVQEDDDDDEEDEDNDRALLPFHWQGPFGPSEKELVAHSRPMHDNRNIQLCLAHLLGGVQNQRTNRCVGSSRA